MAAKLVVIILMVSICKVHSALVRYFPCTDDSSNIPTQAACNEPRFPPQNFQIQPSNSNKGIKASPQLQIVPGQNYNLQAIPVSELNGSNLQRGQLLNLGCNFPQQNYPSPASQKSGCNFPQQNYPSPASQKSGCNSPQQSNQYIPSSPKFSSAPQQSRQLTPTPQVQSSLQLIQPSLCGPSSVITAPVSTITIPPSDATTIIDYSLSNCLANALQMLIANDFINKNVNQECQTPTAETVPGWDLAAFIKSLNANQLNGIPTTNQVVTVPSQGQVASIPKQGQLANNNRPAVSVNDWENLLDRLRESGQCDSLYDWEKVLDYLNQQSGQTAAVKPNEQVPKYSQKPNVGGTDSGVLEALAAYFGCDVSEVCSNSYPNAGQIYFPEEIPAQLVCTYGYMPTTVPVISFSVEPVNVADASNGFVVGC